MVPKILPLESIPIPYFAHFGILSQINFWTKSRHLEQCAVTTYPLEQFQSLPESKGPKADEDWSFCKLTYHEQIKSRAAAGNKKRENCTTINFLAEEGTKHYNCLHNGQRSVKTFSISSQRKTKDPENRTTVHILVNL